MKAKQIEDFATEVGNNPVVSANTSHSQNNTQAHSDYLLNTGDTTSGDYTFGIIKTPAVHIDRTNENGGILNPFLSLGLHHFHGDANSITIQKAGNDNKLKIDSQAGTLLVSGGNSFVLLDGPQQSFMGYSYFDFRVIQHNDSSNNLGKYLHISNDIASSGSRGHVAVAGDLVVNDYSTLSAVEKIRLGNDGTGSFAGDIRVAGATIQEAMASDPPDPSPGNSVQWVSDGTWSGDAGDVMMKINVGGVVKITTLIDFSTI